MRVAIVHYWLLNMRGGERVVEELCRLYPEADIYTHVARPEALSPTINEHRIHQTWISKLPGARRFYQKYLPLMPFALEHLDLRGYELVISSESGPAKGVVVDPEAIHICYCHSPMRYVWNMYHDYREQAGWLTRLVMPVVMPALRMWDYITAARVDHFVCNSNTTASRVKRYYRRESTIVNPPVDISRFSVGLEREDYFVHLGALVGYKRVDLVVQAFTKMNLPLLVIGDGEELKKVKAGAGNNIEFITQASDKQIADYLQRARALVFAAQEDFGIVPLEAMASGTPVIAYNKGGATETVVDGVTGLFFDEQSVESLTGAIESFLKIEQEFDRMEIRERAEMFHADRFREQMKDAIDSAFADRSQGCPGRGSSKLKELPKDDSDNK